MLILTRNVGETIRIGDDIEISIAEIRGGAVRVSIKAPREVRVYREEVYQRIALAATVAAQVTANAASALAAATSTTETAPARSDGSTDSEGQDQGTAPTSADPENVREDKSV